jgi:hypothetical protein
MKQKKKAREAYMLHECLQIVDHGLHGVVRGVEGFAVTALIKGEQTILATRTRTELAVRGEQETKN